MKVDDDFTRKKSSPFVKAQAGRDLAVMVVVVNQILDFLLKILDGHQRAQNKK
jgi:hypothetical protein